MYAKPPNHPAHEQAIVACYQFLHAADAVAEDHGAACDCRVCEVLEGMYWPVEQARDALEELAGTMTPKVQRAINRLVPWEDLAVLRGGLESLTGGRK